MFGRLRRDRSEPEATRAGARADTRPGGTHGTGPAAGPEPTASADPFARNRGEARAVPVGALPGGYFEAREMGGEIVLTDASEAFARLAGQGSAEGLRGLSLGALIGRSGLSNLTRLERGGALPRDVQRDVAVTSPGGIDHATLAAKVSDEAGGTRRWSGLLLDATERRRDQERIYSLAYFDPLTTLPNRRLFLERLEAAASGPPRRRRFGMLAFLDLDNFKILNDTKGHAAGDELLISIAQRLGRCVPDGATVGRLGGDEFVILVEELDATEEGAWDRARGLARLILGAIAKPVPVGEGEAHSVTGSIGLTLFEHGTSARDALLQQADLAMYEAKAAGKDAVRRFDAGLMRRTRETNEMIVALGRAIDHDELHVALQPKVNAGGRVDGAEMLVRWSHPTLGTVPPSTFVPLAEQNGMIGRLNEWAIRRGAAILLSWREDPQRAELELAVNVSAHQFLREDFPSLVARALPSHERRKLLTIEMTERVMADKPHVVARTMAALRDLGVRMSLDDFGTGYSSLDMLKGLPIGELKIDGSFVRGIDASDRNQGLVRAMLAMARSLDMRAVAECVETGAEMEFLLSEGCRHFQGYLFSRPVSPEVFAELIALGVAGGPAAPAAARATRAP